VFTQGCGALAFMVRSPRLETHFPPVRPACLVNVHMMLTQGPGARGLPRGSLQRKGGRLLLRHRTMTIPSRALCVVCVVCVVCACVWCVCQHSLNSRGPGG
jgi:hypothetical protein